MAKRFSAHETSRHHQLEGTLLAGFGQRAFGFLADFLIVLILWIPLELGWARYVSKEWDGESHYNIAFSLHEWRSLAVALGYFVVANYFTNGRSIGKWLARTRVVSLKGERLTLWQCTERVLGYAVSAAEGVGFLLFFFGANRMCMHDRMAETIVIDLRLPADSDTDVVVVQPSAPPSAGSLTVSPAKQSAADS